MILQSEQLFQILFSFLKNKVYVNNQAGKSWKNKNMLGTSLCLYL